MPLWTGGSHSREQLSGKAKGEAEEKTWEQAYKDLREEWREKPISYAKQRLGLTPTHQQRDLLNAIREPGSKVTARSGHGTGKAQPCDLIIPTPNGPRRFGDLKPGDHVFGADGRQAKVLAVHPQGVKEIFEVAFNDGSSTLCCGDHLWTVMGRDGRRIDRPGGPSLEWIVISTNELIRRGLKRNNGAYEARQWEIPLHGPVEFAERSLPIDPYIAGLWLGDGRDDGRITVADDEIIDRLNPRSIGSKQGTHAKSISLNGMRECLKSVGLLGLRSHEKFIPDILKYTPIDVRMNVLKGLMDSDGTVDNSRGLISFCSVSERLANDVQWLVRSLGGRASISFKQAWYSGKNGKRVIGKQAFNVAVSCRFECFSLTRKQALCRPAQERYAKRWMDYIEPAGDAECICITIDREDGLYLTNDFIVTHNSAALAVAIWWKLECFDYSKVPCTAPSAVQLRDILWAEVSKWYRRSLDMSRAWGMPQDFWLSTLFEITQDKISCMGAPREWFAVARTARPEQPDALQGFHASDITISEDGRTIVIDNETTIDTHKGQIMFVIEEAGGVHDKIFEVAEGALSSPNASLLMGGNPTRATGYFAASHKQNRAEFTTLHFRSSDSPLVAPGYRPGLVRKFGEGSNVVRVRADGEFPRADDDTLIPLDAVEAAVSRAHVDDVEPGDRRLGVDIARYGDDRTVFLLRDGPNVEHMRIEAKLDTMRTTGIIVNLIRKWHVNSVHLDISGGLGAGPYDRLKEMQRAKKLPEGLLIIGVNVAEKAPHRSGLETEHQPFRLRDYLWLEMSDWIMTGEASFSEVAKDMAEDLAGELCSVKYMIDSSGRLVIESKDMMKRRGLRSCDLADALGTTFFSAGVIGPGAALFEIVRQQAAALKKKLEDATHGQQTAA